MVQGRIVVPSFYEVYQYIKIKLIKIGCFQLKVILLFYLVIVLLIYRI
jgi:hypothetical protein